MVSGRFLKAVPENHMVSATDAAKQSHYERQDSESGEVDVRILGAFGADAGHGTASAGAARAQAAEERQFAEADIMGTATRLPSESFLRS